MSPLDGALARINIEHKIAINREHKNNNKELSPGFAVSPLRALCQSAEPTEAPANLQLNETAEMSAALSAQRQQARERARRDRKPVEQ